MAKIKNINDISLDSINFKKSNSTLENYLDNGTDNGLFSSINSGVKKIGVHDPDDSMYRATMVIQGTVFFGDIEKDESESQVLANLAVEYSLNFETVERLSKEELQSKKLDESLGIELIDIMEPYFREILDQMLSRAKIHMPLLPYNIKEKTYDQEV